MANANDTVTYTANVTVTESVTTSTETVLANKRAELEATGQWSAKDIERELRDFRRYLERETSRTHVVEVKFSGADLAKVISSAQAAVGFAEATENAKAVLDARAAVAKA